MMTTARRFTALATALFALSAGVSAATIVLPTIDLEAAGATAIKEGKPGAVTSEAGGRLILSGAYGYAPKMFTGEDSAARPGELNEDGTCGIGKCNESGFIVNRNRGDSNGKDIVLTLNDKAAGFADAFFQSITFDLFTSSASGIDIFLYSDSDGTSKSSDNFSPGDGNKFWNPGAEIAVADLLPNVNRIVFAVGSSTLGLDNLIVTVGGVTTAPPPSVPEPASMALVGLALLAAGAARRRRA